MLVLTRKPGEGITLTVAPSATTTEIHLILIKRSEGGHIKFGIECDEATVKILRDELFVKEQQS